MRLASFSVTGLFSQPEPRKARAARAVAIWRSLGGERDVDGLAVAAGDERGIDGLDALAVLGFHGAVVGKQVFVERAGIREFS